MQTQRMKGVAVAAKLKVLACTSSEVCAWAPLHLEGVNNLFLHHLGISRLLETWIAWSELYETTLVIFLVVFLKVSKERPHLLQPMSNLSWPGPKHNICWSMLVFPAGFSVLKVFVGDASMLTARLPSPVPLPAAYTLTLPLLLWASSQGDSTQLRPTSCTASRATSLTGASSWCEIHTGATPSPVCAEWPSTGGVFLCNAPLNQTRITVTVSESFRDEHTNTRTHAHTHTHVPSRLLKNAHLFTRWALLQRH